MTTDLPYRECKNCDSLICCKNINVEIDGKVTLPDECVKKDEREIEIKEHYEHVRV